MTSSVIKVQAAESKIHIRANLAGNAEILKDIKATIRSEIKDLVCGDIGEKTKEYYERLYDDKILKFKQLTTGHAANPDIKDQINIYMEAGNYQIPMEPISNAGRMRALFLSFVFALIGKSSGSLNMIMLDDPALSLDDQHMDRLIRKIITEFLAKSQTIIATHYELFYKRAEHIFETSECLKMPPKRLPCDSVCFEPGDLLQRIEDSLKKQTCQWRECADNMRIWVERTIKTISRYCPEPFAIYSNNMPACINKYKGIVDPRIATDNRKEILNILTEENIHRLHEMAHDEEITDSEVKDMLGLLKKCKRFVDREIDHFKTIYNHEKAGGGISHRPAFSYLSMKSSLLNIQHLKVVRAAAAAHNGQGIEWDCLENISIENCSTVLVGNDTLEPIALVGQHLLLDAENREPKDGDIVIVETDDKAKYLRRFWTDNDRSILLESVNPTKPYKPVRIVSSMCKIRRVVGVLYDNTTPDNLDNEWLTRGFDEKWFDDVVGIRVKGTSLEPLARNNQVVLIKKKDIKTQLSNDMLACFSVDQIGEVIKRCHTKDSKCILSAVNPNEREKPIVVNITSIQQAYELKGVLFELASKIP